MNIKIIKHNEKNIEQATINLPIALLRSCKDKNILLKVALSVFIKAHHGDSMLRNVSVRNLMKVLHCGQNKASKCLYELNNNPEMFMPVGCNSFIAKSFKSYIKEEEDKYGRTIYECYCHKMTISKYWSLRDIEKYLQDILLVYAINAKERKAISLNCKNNIEDYSLSNSSEWLTLNKLAHISGLSRSTARRHIKSLENNRKITIRRGQTEFICAASNDAIKYLGMNNHHITFSKNGLAMIFTPNEYSIANRKLSDSFVNIIYNHKKRNTLNRSFDTSDYFEIMEH